MDFSALRVLVPQSPRGDMDDFLRGARTRAVSPFDTSRTAALEELSQRLLRHPRLRRDPGGAALGFWLRRSHLAGLREDFERTAPREGCRVPAGLVLHLAPANVDTMFVLSWALSFLAGNTNLVRLTTRPNAIVEDLLGCLEETFCAHAEAAGGNLFVTYEHNDALTTRLSLACDRRVIWGGDETVRRIRALPLNPHASERAFSSKRSLSLIDVAAYVGAGEAVRRHLSEHMAADLAPFGQMACSSPHVLYWVGDSRAAREAVADFDPRLETAMAAKMGEPDLGWATRRVTHAFAAAAEGRARAVAHRPHVTSVQAASVETAEAAEMCGAGLVTHAHASSLDDIVAVLRPDHQTITYFGLEEVQRSRLGIVAGRAGVARIVPVGRALEFGPQWDGFDLWSDLTRVVVVQ